MKRIVSVILMFLCLAPCWGQVSLRSVDPKEDAEAVAQSAAEQGLKRVGQQMRDGWVVMVCKKQ